MMAMEVVVAIIPRFDMEVLEEKPSTDNRPKASRRSTAAGKPRSCWRKQYGTPASRRFQPAANRNKPSGTTTISRATIGEETSALCSSETPKTPA